MKETTLENATFCKIRLKKELSFQKARYDSSQLLISCNDSWLQSLSDTHCYEDLGSEIWASPVFLMPETVQSANWSGLQMSSEI